MSDLIADKAIFNLQLFMFFKSSGREEQAVESFNTALDILRGSALKTYVVWRTDEDDFFVTVLSEEEMQGVDVENSDAIVIKAAIQEYNVDENTAVDIIGGGYDLITIWQTNDNTFLF